MPQSGEVKYEDVRIYCFSLWYGWHFGVETASGHRKLTPAELDAFRQEHKKRWAD